MLIVLASSRNIIAHSFFSHKNSQVCYWHDAIAISLAKLERKKKKKEKRKNETEGKKWKLITRTSVRVCLTRLKHGSSSESQTPRCFWKYRPDFASTFFGSVRCQRRSPSILGLWSRLSTNESWAKQGRNQVKGETKNWRKFERTFRSSIMENIDRIKTVPTNGIDLLLSRYLAR